jgi:flagellar motility protein MotE (MotC chaperone)
MIKIASNPIVVLALALVLGVGTGLGWFWKAAVPLIAAAKAARAKIVDVGKPEAPWGFWTLEIENLASELKEQKAVVKKREEELAQRDERLTAERQELAKQRQQLESMRIEISNQIVTIQADEVKNLKSLVATYSNLTPKATLTIFKEMDDIMVVKLLSLMKTDTVSPLFEEMSKQGVSDPAMARRVAALSEKLRLLKSAQNAPAP